MKKAEFHLALPCEDIGKTKDFYTNILGATLGRHTDNWIDINLYGNQITFTKAGTFNFDFKNYRLGDQILPSFHFCKYFVSQNDSFRFVVSGHVTIRA